MVNTRRCDLHKGAIHSNVCAFYIHSDWFLSPNQCFWP